MIIAIKNGFYQIEEDGMVLRTIPIGVLGEVGDFDSRRLTVKQGSPVTMGAAAGACYKGMIIKSDNVLSVETSGPDITISYGSDIALRGVYADEITIANQYKLIDYGKIATVDSHESGSLLLVKNTNYTYSKLLSNESIGPYNTEGSYMNLFLENRPGMTIEFKDVKTLSEDGTPRATPLEYETAQAVCDAFNRVSLGLTGGVAAVRMTYSSVTHRFTITAAEAGVIDMQVGEDTVSRHLGFLNPELMLGTEDFAGKMLKFVSGNAKGLTASIVSIAGGEIILNNMPSPVPAENDEYIIYDNNVSAIVDIVMLT
jgi:hypothetical protein